MLQFCKLQHNTTQYFLTVWVQCGARFPLYNHRRPGSKLPYKAFVRLAQILITGGRYKSLSWRSNTSAIISCICLAIQNASEWIRMLQYYTLCWKRHSDTWFPSGIKVLKWNISQSIPGSTSSERTLVKLATRQQNNQLQSTSYDVVWCLMRPGG